MKHLVLDTGSKIQHPCPGYTGQHNKAAIAWHSHYLEYVGISTTYFTSNIFSLSGHNPDTLQTWHTSMDVVLCVSKTEGPTDTMTHQENIISAICNKDFLVVVI